MNVRKRVVKTEYKDLFYGLSIFVLIAIIVALSIGLANSRGTIQANTIDRPVVCECQVQQCVVQECPTLDLSYACDMCMTSKASSMLRGLE